MTKKKKKEEDPRVHEELKGFSIKTWRIKNSKSERI